MQQRPHHEEIEEECGEEYESDVEEEEEEEEIDITPCDGDMDERALVVLNGATFRLCTGWSWRSSQREGGRMDTVWRSPDNARIRSVCFQLSLSSV